MFAFALASVTEQASCLMVSEGVQLALIVAVPAFLSPLLLLIGTRLLDRGDKKRQHEREDQVRKQVADAAEKAEEVARLLAESNRTAAKRFESAVAAVAAANSASGKLDGYN